MRTPALPRANGVADQFAGCNHVFVRQYAARAACELVSRFYGVDRTRPRPLAIHPCAPDFEISTHLWGCAVLVRHGPGTVAVAVSERRAEFRVRPIRLRRNVSGPANPRR